MSRERYPYHGPRSLRCRRSCREKDCIFFVAYHPDRNHTLWQGSQCRPSIDDWWALMTIEEHWWLFMTIDNLNEWRARATTKRRLPPAVLELQGTEKKIALSLDVIANLLWQSSWLPSAKLEWHQGMERWAAELDNEDQDVIHSERAIHCLLAI